MCHLSALSQCGLTFGGMKRAGFAERVFVHRCKCRGACLPAKAGGRIARKPTKTGMFYYRVLGVRALFLFIIVNHF
jgi:hypothetical protein